MRHLLRCLRLVCRATLVIGLAVATFLVMDGWRDASYPTVLQADGTGAGLRRLKRILNYHRNNRPANEIGKNHELVHQAFQDVVAGASRSTVLVQIAGEQAALGVAVAPDRVLTKASELGGRISCRQPGTPRWKARVVGTDRRFDLALLEVPGANLTPVRWPSSQGPLPIGSFVAVPGADSDEPIVVGLVSAAARNIVRDNGLLGVKIEQAGEGPRVIRVLDGSTAQHIGLRVDDIVTHVAGQRVRTQFELIRRVQSYRPNDTVEVEVLRDGAPIQLSAVLGRKTEILAAEQGFDEHVGGELSIRRTGFPAIIQHDCALQPNQCGGPLVNLDGDLVGLNIARASRVASYALPAAAVRERLRELGWLSRK